MTSLRESCKTSMFLHLRHYPPSNSVSLPRHRMSSCTAALSVSLRRSSMARCGWSAYSHSLQKQISLSKNGSERIHLTPCKLRQPRAPRKPDREHLRCLSEASGDGGSSLLSHSCCGGSAGASSGKNWLHSLLLKTLSSLAVLTWIREQHHSRLGVGIAAVGFVSYLSPIPLTLQMTRLLGMTSLLCFSGLPLFYNALLQISQLEVDTSVLMSLSVVGSIYLGMAGEGMLLLILFQISHWLEAKSTNRSKASLRALLESVPDKAVVVDVHPATSDPVMDTATVRNASEVPVGTFILIKPGEQVPLDGVLVSGSASVTVEHISGESLPILVRVGSTVAAGSHNADGLLVLRTIATMEDSTPTKIAQLALDAQTHKPKVHRWIDGLMTVWSKCALLASFGVAVACVGLGVPFFGARGALYRSLCIVTAAAPCALVLAPLAYVCALANASHRNILIRSAAVLDTLHDCMHVALDKTGTLTEGKLTCTNIVNAEDITREKAVTYRQESVVGSPLKHRALCYAVDLSKCTTHPIANAVLAAGRRHLPPEDGNCKVSDFELVPGYGVRGTIVPKADEHRPVFANFGSIEFIQEQLNATRGQQELEKAVDAVRDRYGNSVSVLTTTTEPDGGNLEWSAFCFRDELLAVTKAAVAALQEGSWKNGKKAERLKKRITILTGDHEASARPIGESLDVQDVISEHKPEDKLNFIQSSQKSMQQKHGMRSGLVMVGDGINDAPALAQADVGISISETATDLSAAASDIVILNGQGVANLPFLFLLSDRLRSIVRQNLILAFSAMVIVCLPSLKGWMPLWLTVLIHEGSTVLAALNSCRLLLLQPQKLKQS